MTTSFVDLNMGLLGPRLALSEEYSCLKHVPGDPLAEALWEQLAGATPRPPLAGSTAVPGADRPDLAFAYLSHRDMLSCAREAERGGPNPLESILRCGARHLLMVSTLAAPRAQKGYPFLLVLSSLRAHGYRVAWFTTSAYACGLPHDAHYTIVVASDERETEPEGGFRDLASAVGTLISGKSTSVGTLSEETVTRKPQLGRARRQMSVLSAAGQIVDDVIHGWNVRFPLRRDLGISLREIVSPDVEGADPRPVRLVSRHGIAGPAFKRIPASFALGPGTSASPLFAFEQNLLGHAAQGALTKHADWTCLRDGYLIVRLRASRAVLLHGRSAGIWEAGLQNLRASVGASYALISRGLPPEMIRTLAAAVSRIRAPGVRPAARRIDALR